MGGMDSRVTTQQDTLNQYVNDYYQRHLGTMLFNATMVQDWASKWTSVTV